MISGFIFCLIASCNGLRIPDVGEQASGKTIDFAKQNVQEDVRRTDLELKKDDAIFAKQMELSSTMNIGRAGSKKCLTFLHIPKTGGSTIEDESITLTATDNSVRHWGMLDSDLECSAEDKFCHFSYAMKGRSGKAKCSKWHVPPHLDKKLAASYVSDGCETFCAVRSPYQRFMSAVKKDVLRHKRAQGCTVPMISATALRMIEQTKASPYAVDCKFVSQTEYIYGDSDKPQFCDHQLRQENLKEDFDKLMVKFDIPLTMTVRSNPSETCNGSMDENAESASKEFVKTYYADDLKNFNYDM